MGTYAEIPMGFANPQDVSEPKILKATGKVFNILSNLIRPNKHPMIDLTAQESNSKQKTTTNTNQDT
eukprot:12962285-Ditylum_brightwellii.AAC.1